MHNNTVILASSGALTLYMVQCNMYPLLTLKLHLVVCHLPDQELSYGPTPGMLEYWVERLMQAAKRDVKGRDTCANVTELYVDDMFL